jgi:hypothetical protein
MNTKKCAVKAKQHIAPVEGSVNDTTNTGTCPTCLTPGIKLSKGGHIGAHSVAVEIDPTLPVVDLGTPKGDPRDATVRRAVEARLIAAEQLPMPVAPSAPEGRDEKKNRAASSPGPALVRGRAMAPVQPQSGFLAVAGTMYGPIGRDRMDRESSTVPMHGGTYGYLTEAEYEALSRTQQRKYWAKLRSMAQRSEQRRSDARKSRDAKAGQVGSEIQRLRKIGNQA